MPWAWSRPYSRLLMRWGTRRARRIIAVSQHTAGDLAHYYGTPRHKTVVVPEGADPSFTPVTDASRQAVVALGLDGRVAFLNWVAEADLPGLYSLADLVVLPSVMEGFGLPA